MQTDHGVPDLGHPRSKFLDLGGADLSFAQTLPEVGHQARIGIGGEEVRGQVEALGKRQQHWHRHRPLVVLQLIDVAGRKVQRPRQRYLSEAVLFPQPA